MRVLVSTIPTVVDRIVVSPQWVDWSIPQYLDAGEVVASGTYFTEPVMTDF